MKRFSLFAASLAVVATLTTGAALAEALNEIDLGQPAKPLTLPPGQQTVIKLNNPTADPQVLRVPSLGIVTEVPPRTFRYIYVNSDTLPRRQFAYMVGSQNVTASAQTGSTRQYTSTMKSISLDSIINYSTQYHAESKSEPVYYDRKPAPHYASSETAQPAADSETIRGYW